MTNTIQSLGHITKKITAIKLKVGFIYTHLIITLTVGYDEVPYDLKQSLYELALYRMERKVAKADLISRVEDNNGTATSYRADEIPKHIKMIFMEYMGRRLTFS